VENKTKPRSRAGGLSHRADPFLSSIATVVARYDVQFASLRNALELLARAADVILKLAAAFGKR
jgi:hypothetical protein